MLTADHGTLWPLELVYPFCSLYRIVCRLMGICYHYYVQLVLDLEGLQKTILGWKKTGS